MDSPYHRGVLSDDEELEKNLLVPCHCHCDGMRSLRDRHLRPKPSKVRQSNGLFTKWLALQYDRRLHHDVLPDATPGATGKTEKTQIGSSCTHHLCPLLASLARDFFFPNNSCLSIT